MSTNMFDLSPRQDSSESQSPPETFKCTKCEKHFPVADRDKHELICLYSLEVKAKDIDDIPCEKCSKMVSFDEYASHLNMCGLDQSLINDIYMNMRMDSQPPSHYSFARRVGNAKKTPKNDSEHSQKRPKKSDNEEETSPYGMTSFFQHIGNLIGGRTNPEDIISAIEDELNIDEPVNETDTNSDSEDEPIEEPTIEPSHIDTGDDMNELDRFEKAMQSFYQMNQSNRDESKPYYETSVTPPPATSSSTVEEPVEAKPPPAVPVSNTSLPSVRLIDTEGVSSYFSEDGVSTFKFSLRPFPLEHKEPKEPKKDGDDTKDDSTNESKPTYGYEWRQPFISASSSFNISNETLSSRPSSTYQPPEENSDNEPEDDEFPRLPNTVNANHGSALTRLNQHLSTRTYLDFIDQRQRRNAVPNIRPYIPSYGGYSSSLTDEQMSSLPPELKAMMDIVNASQSSRRRSYVPMFMRRYNDEENETYEELKSLCERTGVVELGVSNMDAVAPFTELEDGKACAICDTDETEKKYRKIVCGHPDIFCDECATKWLSKNRACPVCTKNLEDYYISMMSEDELSMIEQELGLTDGSGETIV